MTNELWHSDITIVIPTLNEESDITECMQCIINNNISMLSIEVLIIDGGSNDKTIEKVENFKSKLPIKIINASGSTVYQALNIGLKDAQGEYFIRVDARSKIPNNYIEKCIDILQNEEIGCVGGIQKQYGDSIISSSIADATNSILGTGGAKYRTSKISGYVDTVYLGAYRTERLIEMGGFEDGSKYVSEDAYMNKKLIDAGYKIFLDANLIVAYPAKSTFRKLIKQYLIYGAAKAFIFQKYRTITSFRQVVPLLFLIFWLILLISCIANLIPWIFFKLSTSVYFFLIIICSIELSSNKTDNMGRVWARAMALVCIHFSWPVGFFLFLMNPKLHRRLVLWL